MVVRVGFSLVVSSGSAAHRSRLAAPLGPCTASILYSREEGAKVLVRSEKVMNFCPAHLPPTIYNHHSQIVLIH